MAVLDSAGQLAMEAILETKAETILQFIHGLRGRLHVTLEEGTWRRGCTTCSSRMTLKELARSYLAITRDLTRVMSRLKAIYRSWAIPGAGQQVYAPRYRTEWLAKIAEGGVRRHAELYYQQFDCLRLCASQRDDESAGAVKSQNLVT